MPGIGLDGSKNKKKNKTRRPAKQKAKRNINQEFEEDLNDIIKQELDEKENKESFKKLGTYAVLDGISIDITKTEPDWYLSWISENFETEMQPIIDVMDADSLISSAIKEAISKYNSGDFVNSDTTREMVNEKTEQIKVIPKDMEVDIY